MRTVLSLSKRPCQAEGTSAAAGPQTLLHQPLELCPLFNAEYHVVMCLTVNQVIKKFPLPEPHFVSDSRISCLPEEYRAALARPSLVSFSWTSWPSPRNCVRPLPLPPPLPKWELGIVVV